MDALKEDQSDWAQKAYFRMQKSDPLALELTFKLLKEAEQSPWIKCLENQFAVARRLLEQSELELRTF